MPSAATARSTTAGFCSMSWTSWPAAQQVVGDEEADVPGAGDGDSHPLLVSCARGPARAAVRARRATRCRRRSGGRRPPGRPRSGAATCAAPNRVTAVSQNEPGSFSRASFLPAPGRGHGVARRGDLAARVDPVVGLLAGEQASHHLVGGPRHGRDGGDAEPLVDQGPAGVVDAGDHVFDAEGLAGDAGDEDVRVVAVGHRGDRAGLLDARLAEGGRGRSRTRRPAGP